MAINVISVMNHFNPNYRNDAGYFIWGYVADMIGEE